MVKLNCPVCTRIPQPSFSHLIMGRYSCTYLYCEHCGFLHAEKPHWINEAYSDAIADADTGILQRNITLSRITASLIYFIFDKNKKYLDLAGGYGLLTRLMRDTGFDYHWSDKYCTNLFAKGFEQEKLSKYVATSAYEVLEHLENPVDFIAEAIQKSESSSLICSTELFAGSPPPETWWYYAFPTGQHISFYQLKTLRFIAQKLGVNLYSNRSIHLFTKKKIANSTFRLLTSPQLSRLTYLAPRFLMKSKTMEDHLTMINVSSNISGQE